MATFYLFWSAVSFLIFLTENQYTGENIKKLSVNGIENN